MWATTTLVSTSGSGSKKPEQRSSIAADEIYSWSNRLASEDRELKWILKWYVWPETVLEIIHRLDGMNGGIIGLVGFQGVGKTSALLAINFARAINEQKESRLAKASKDQPDSERGTIRFKWRRQSELLTSLLNGAHEASDDFRSEYSRALVMQVKANYPHLVPEELEKNPEKINPNWVAKYLGRSVIRSLQQTSWLNMLRKKKVILIDTPDYSKSDRRLATKDLDELYWLWDSLSQPTSLENDPKPTMIVAIQKEMPRDHFFFDKMAKVELQPLEPKKMIAAYHNRFKTYEPFTEEALLKLARMSRGIFRRFLRYITLTLRYSELHSKKIIDTETVKAAVTVERLVEDMESALAELFPKQSDLRLQAVRLLMLLEESGPRKQAELAEELGVKPYAMSRLLDKLENRYIIRRREGTDKLVSLVRT